MGRSISRLLDGECTPQEELEIERHLEVCDPCRAFRDELERVDRLVAASIGPDLDPSAVFEAVRNEIAAAAPPGQNRRQSSPAWIRAAAAAALVACSIWAGIEALHARRAVRRADEALRAAESLHDTARRMLDDTAGILSDIAAGRRAETQRMLRQFAPPESALAHVDAGGVWIAAKFLDEERYASFDVERRPAGAPQFEGPLNHQPLPRPEFFDDTAAPGTRYEYRFTGIRRDGARVAGPIVAVELPAAPAAAAHVTLLSVSEDGRHASFLIEEDTGSCRVEAALGGRIAAGGRSFRIEDISIDDELCTATFAWPKTTEQGELVYDPDGSVCMELVDRVIAIRRNWRAVLRDDAGRLVLWHHARTPVVP
jgi:hypothetical protein